MFKKSSFSNSSCVAVDIRDDTVVVRNDSNPAIELSFDHAEWSAFVAGVKAGEFACPGPIE